MNFNDENIFNGYIKNILSSFNLPQCKVFNSEQHLKNYFSNLKANNIGSQFPVIIKKWKDLKDCLVNVTFKGSGNFTFDFIDYYIFNSEYLNITKQFNNTSNIYESETHRYLGNYLRFIRDFNNINLMSLYNCFSNEIMEDKEFKYIKIPVKFNSTYTLGLNILNKFSYILTFKQDRDEILKLFNENNEENIKNIHYLSKCTFDTPITLNIPKVENLKDMFNENNLNIIIKVPILNTSVINILEGQYINSCANIKVNNEKLENSKEYLFKYNDVDLHNLISNIYFLKKSWMYKKQNIPFSPRLIEYLIDNVICPKDRISKNIIDAKYKFISKYTLTYDDEIQKFIPKSDSKIGVLNSGVDNIDRLNMNSLTNLNKSIVINKEDLLFYIDKDIEALLDDERYPNELCNKYNKEVN